MRRLLQLARSLAPAATILFVVLLPTAANSARQASLADPCAPVINPVACENSKPGSPPSAWQISGNGDSTIQGFATDTSVDHGQTINFKIKTDASAYTITIFRLGYYQGNGARQVATVTPSASLPQTQPACLTDNTTHLVDCGNWAVSASWNVPADAVSGIYLALLTRSDTHGVSEIPFIVRADDSHSDILFQADDTSWNAYNTYGGYSLYRPDTSTRAYAVSFNRPYTTRTDNPLTYVWADDYPMLRWMEQNGYDVSYFSGVDTDRYGSELLNHKTFISVGHDEYWSGQERANVESARDSGVNLAFFSGNEVFWKTRYAASMDSSATSYRTLVCYKETAANAKIDPSPQWTGTWADPRFSPPSDGGRPQNALTGQEFMVNGYREDAITVPAAYAKLRLWRNTSVASLTAGQTATFPVGTLGYEWDEDVDNGFRPAGQFDLSSTTLSVQTVLQDWGNTYGPGTAIHNLTEYRAPSGALVFGAGTAQWAWGLDSNHDVNSSTPPQPPDVRMQQATVNLFADMGAQPATLQTALVAATASTDHTAPTSTISSPTSSTSIHANAPVTISGTAVDGGGGVVGGVEVSWDNGATWHEASGTSSWSYTWTPATAGAAVIRSRAVDDSGNIETPSAGVTVQVQAGVNLVAAYAFNEGTGTVAHDASPAGNDGTVTNATWTTGKYGGGLNFNGTNAWVTVPDAASLDLTTGMTIEAWVDPSATGTAWRTTVMKENGSGLAYALYANTSNSSPSGYAGGAQAAGSSQIPLNTWTHLAVTYDGSTVRLYMNGTQVGTQPNSSPIPVSAGALRIGGNSIWGEYFSGIIDEVRIYKAALTPTQIQADMGAPIQTTPADTTPPTVSMTAPANNASLSGTTTVSANAADNVGVTSVQFKLDGQNLGSALTTGPYTMQWDTSQTSNGTHTLTAVASDAAGNVTTSNTVTVTTSNVDTTPPSVSITAPVSGANVSGIVSVTANATDNQGVVGVQFKLDGQNLGNEDTTAPYAIAWDTSAASLGPHTLTAIARDAAGNNSTSPAVNVTLVLVDTTPPTVSITAPANNATVTGSVPLTATAADNVGVAGVTFRVDGSTVGSEDTTSPYGITWDTTTVGNGTHTLTAVARDAAGNTTTSTAVTVTVSNALTGMVAAYSFNEGSGTTVADTSGHGNTGTITNATWTASGKYGGALSFNGTNAWVTVPDSASLDLTTGMTLEAWLDPTTLSSWRSAIMKETSNDLAWAMYANTSSNVPSGYAGSSQVVGSSILPLNAWTFVTVTYDRTALKIYVNGTQISTQPTTLSMPTSTQPLRIGGDAPWGEYFNGKIDDIRIYNRALSASEVTSDMATPVQAPAPDTTPPTVSLTSPTNNATVGGTVSLAASASDNVGVASVQFKLDGQNLGSPVTTAPYTLSWDSTAAANGTHTLSAVASDAAGNTATSSATVTVSNDHTAPTVSFTAPPANGSISGTVAVSATASDNVGVTSVQFKLDGANLGSPDTTLPYSVNWDTTTATNSTHTLSAVASDAAGNTQTATETVTVSNVDSVPPTVSLTAPSNNATVSGSIPVSANASDNVAVASVQFKLDGANLGSPDTTSPYSITWATTGATNGTHTLTAVATDPAGNSTTSAPITVTVSNDLTPPTVSLTAPTAGATVTGSISVSANASDNVGVASVQFKLDGASLGSPDTTSPYSITWDTTTATNGTHTLTAVATDAAGNATTSAAVSVTVSNVSVVQGLVAAYSFDEGAGTTVGDSSGLGNTGTIANATWKTTGKYGNTLSFNGTNAWVTVPDSPSLDLTTGMTLEAWLDPTTVSSWRAALIKEMPTDLAWGIYANTSSNRWSGNVGSYELDSRAQLAVNTWTFVTVTYNKSQINLYLNGGLISSTPATITLPTSTQPLRIGGDSIWGEYFNGMIDNVRIYNRALSAAEITTDMSKPVGAGG